MNFYQHMDSKESQPTDIKEVDQESDVSLEHRDKKAKAASQPIDSNSHYSTSVLMGQSLDENNSEKIQALFDGSIDTNKLTQINKEVASNLKGRLSLQMTDNSNSKTSPDLGDIKLANINAKNGNNLPLEKPLLPPELKLERSDNNNSLNSLKINLGISNRDLKMGGSIVSEKLNSNLTEEQQSGIQKTPISSFTDSKGLNLDNSVLKGITIPKITSADFNITPKELSLADLLNKKDPNFNFDKLALGEGNKSKLDSLQLIDKNLNANLSSKNPIQALVDNASLSTQLPKTNPARLDANAEIHKLETPSLNLSPMIGDKIGTQALSAAVTQIRQSIFNPNWSTNLSQHIAQLAINNKSQAEIRLDPPELGSMMVKIHHNGSDALIQFHVQHAEAKVAVDNALDKLRDALHQQGFTQVDVDVQQHDFQQFSQNQNSSSESMNLVNRQKHDATETNNQQPNNTTSLLIDSGIDLFA